MNLPALVRFSQQDVYMTLTILGCTVNCRFRFADCPLIHCGLELHGGNSCDPATSTKLRRRMKEEGRPVRTGKFLGGEDDIIVQNCLNYYEQYPEYNPILLFHSARSSKEHLRAVRKTFFYARIAEGLNRTSYAVLTRSKYHLFPVYVTRRGKMLSSEKVHLKKLFQKYGRQWNKIGNIMGRSEKGLVANWPAMLATKFGIWSVLEDHMLTQSIKQYRDNTEAADKDLHNSLPWELIAKTVPGRSGVQCRRHWMHKLRNKLFHEDNLFETVKWEKDQLVELVTQICVQEVRFEEDIDFDIIRTHFQDSGFILSREQIHKQWRQLKLKVKNYYIKSFSEILDEVSEFVVSLVTDASTWQ